MEEHINIEEKVRDRLILSGMEELEAHGYTDFSLRRAAQRAQVSCAAPYRHFKDKEAYIEAIVQYVYAKWELLAGQIERVFAHDAKLCAVELCIASLRFRMGNPQFSAVLSLPMAEAYALDAAACRAIDAHAVHVGWDADRTRRKRFVVRATVAGAPSLLCDYGAEGTLSLVRETLLSVLAE